MSMKKQRRWPRILQGLAGYLLTLLLVASLAGACVLTLAEALLTDRTLHERVATDDRVIDLQMARLDGEIRLLAEEHPFTLETVEALITRDSLRDYNRESVAWWMGLLGEQPEPEAPFPDTAALAEAVLADELFRENTMEFMRRIVAQDKIAYPIGQTLQETAVPVRVSVIALAMPEVAKRVSIPALMTLLGLVKTGLSAASAALLALLLATQGRNRFVFASAGVLAADALLLAMTAAVWLAHPAEVLESLSAVLALQWRILQEALLPAVLTVEGALLLAGLLLLAVALATGRRASVRAERASA